MKPVVTVIRGSMTEYEKLLTIGREIKWMASNGEEYPATVSKACCDGNMIAGLDTVKATIYIEDVTQIELTEVILRIPRP